MFLLSAWVTDRPIWVLSPKKSRKKAKTSRNADGQSRQTILRKFPIFFASSGLQAS